MALKRNTLKLMLVALIVLFLYNFPTFYPYLKTPPDKVYLGQVSWFDPWDINVYVSAIRWSQNFGLNFQNAYTTEPHKPLIVYPLYTLLGVIFKNVNPFLIFNISTLLACIFLLVVIYKSGSIFLADKKKAVLSLFLIPLAGGLGWAFFPKIPIPDTFMTPFTFANTFQRAHEALAIAFYILALTLFYLNLKGGSKKLTLYSGVCALVFSLFYPFYLLSYYLICGAFAFYRVTGKKDFSLFRHLFLATLISFPFGLFYSLYLRSSSVFNNVFAPNIDTPNPILLSLGYGILIPFLLVQLFTKKSWDKQKVFLNIWFFLSILLAYLPISFGRYYLRGLFLPAVLLTLNYLKSLSPKTNVKRISVKYFQAIVLLFIPLSNLLLISIRLTTSLGVKTSLSNWSFMDKNQYAVYSFLNANTPKGSGILVTYPLSNIVPAQTDNRVYFGHHSQTPNATQKLENIEKFYQNKFTPIEAEKFLKENYIKYTLVTNNEDGFSRYAFLERTFEIHPTTVYQVKD